LRFRYGRAERLDGCLDIDHYAAAQPAARRDSMAEYYHSTFGFYLSNEHADFARADIHSCQQIPRQLATSHGRAEKTG
jgi:hypothetical protein